MNVSDRVRDLVLPVLAERHLELYDLEMHGGVLRVVIDSQSGLQLDDLTGVSRAVSRALDEADPIAGRYTLEVTSPGVERRLRTPEHFQRAVGELVKIRTLPGVADQRRVEGDLMSADDSGISVRTGTSGDGEPIERYLVYNEIERARTVFEWGPAADKGRRPGKGSRRGRAKSDEERERST